MTPLNTRGRGVNVADSAIHLSQVWGDWLRVPFERATAYGEVEMATMLEPRATD